MSYIIHARCRSLATSYLIFQPRFVVCRKFTKKLEMTKFFKQKSQAHIIVPHAKSSSVLICNVQSYFIDDVMNTI